MAEAHSCLVLIPIMTGHSFVEIFFFLFLWRLRDNKEPIDMQNHDP